MSSGKLRVFLGAAPGVGKTYAMLEEGHRLRDLGRDVVIGYVEPHARTDTIGMIGDLEIVPRKQIEYRGSTFEEMNLEAVMRRAPRVALVDELAHTNIPGSPNVKRWQDVEALLDAGIDVLSTLNIQHLESLNDVVFDITDITQRETIPDEVVRRASEIELVDLTQEGIRERMASGKIYPAERIDAALGNYFRPGNLGALRELALSWTADRVDEAVAKYRNLHGIDSQWETKGAPVISTPHFTIDLAAKRVFDADNSEVRLTPTEWGIVEVLVRNHGKLVSQTQLLHDVWGPQYGEETNICGSSWLRCDGSWSLSQGRRATSSPNPEWDIDSNFPSRSPPSRERGEDALGVCMPEASVLVALRTR